jgi:hypothetical protein
VLDKLAAEGIVTANAIGRRILATNGNWDQAE